MEDVDVGVDVVDSSGGGEELGSPIMEMPDWRISSKRREISWRLRRRL